MPPLKHFILPSNHPIVSYAPRLVGRFSVALDQVKSLRYFVLKHLNLLSEYLFILARKLGFYINYTEQKWNIDTRDPK
ncbi:MAG: hypothetical protein ACMUEL_06775 [Flavobacteriales bacterium Tduv]